MRPREAKVGQVGPKRSPKEPKRSPRWFQGSPRGLQDGPKGAEWTPKGSQEVPKEPRWRPESFKNWKTLDFGIVKKPLVFIAKTDIQRLILRSEGFMLAHVGPFWVHVGAFWITMGSWCVCWHDHELSLTIVGAHGASWRALGATMGASMGLQLLPTMEDYLGGGSRRG